MRALAPETEQELDLRTYGRIVLHGWWIFLLAAILIASAAYFASTLQTPSYQATTKIFVQGGASPGQLSSGDISSSRQLAESLTDLIGTSQIMSEVASVVGLPDAASVAAILSARSNRSLLFITATHPDPYLAKDVANIAAEVFIDDFVARQLGGIAQFQAALAQYGIKESLDVVGAQVASLTALTIVERAATPGRPTSFVRLYIILGAIAGLMLGGLLVLLREYLDDRVRTAEELKRITDIGSLGSIGFERREPNRLSTSAESSPRQWAEHYRFIQTNLEFAAVGLDPIRALLITSAEPGDGKSTICAELGISIAEEGKTVILVDSDLRKPTLRDRFGLNGQKGFTNLLAGNATFEEVVEDSGHPGLTIVTSGPLPPDPTRLLRSQALRDVIADLEQHADLVIVDAPPLLAVTDPMLLAPVVDGVLLVVDGRKTRRAAVRRSAEMLYQGRATPLGAVLNKLPRASGRNYGGYGYGYGYGYSSKDDGDGGRRGLRGIFKSFVRRIKLA